MSTYAIIIDVDAPPALVASEGFAGLKRLYIESNQVHQLLS